MKNYVSKAIWSTAYTLIDIYLFHIWVSLHGDAGIENQSTEKTLYIVFDLSDEFILDLTCKACTFYLRLVLWTNYF